MENFSDNQIIKAQGKSLDEKIIDLTLKNLINDLSDKEMGEEEKTIIFNTFLDGIEKKEILPRLYKLIEKFPVNKRPFIIRLIIKNTDDMELKEKYMLKTDKAIKSIHDKELMKKLLDKLIYGNTDYPQ